MTTERVSGVALALLAAAVLEECWRTRLPLGTLANPGPAYMPVLLALALLGSGVLDRRARTATPPALGAAGWQRVAPHRGHPGAPAPSWRSPWSGSATG